MLKLFEKIFSSQNKDEDLCLILDIGNGSVSGNLTIFRKNNKPQSFLTTRMPVTIDEKPTSDQLERVVLDYLDKVVTKIIDHKKTNFYIKNRKIEKVLIVLASPWFSSHDKNIKIEENKSFLVTKDLLKEILDKEVLRFENLVSKDTKNLEVIEKIIVDNKINGYEIPNPMNKKATSFETKVYLSLAKSSFIKKILDSVTKNTHIDRDDIIFHTFPLVCFNSLKTLFHNELNYIHMDITGEITDISYIDDGFIKKNITIPIGKNFFVRKVSKTNSSGFDFGLSLLKSDQKNMLETKESQKISTVLKDCLAEFEIYMENGLEELDINLELPKKVFITVDDDLSDFFLKTIKNPVNFNSKIAEWKKEVTVINIEKNILDQYIDTKNDIYYDKFVIMDSIFFSYFQ